MYATFHMISGANNQSVIPYVKTNYPAEWVSYYLLNGLMKIDPVIRASRNSKDAFFWSEIALTATETDMMKKAKDFGLSAVGYSVPTFDVGPYRGLLSICPRPEDVGGWTDKVKSEEPKIIDLAFTIHNLARTDIDPYEGYPVNLSRREVECLRHIATGKTHTEMASILDISDHTVRSYCRTARLKLNSSTLAQAVAKACAMGII
jgi:DNA-binding CsgD family transcriptional regulator